MTNLIDNKGDELFSTIFPNPGKETILLLHGGPGFPSDLLEVSDILKDNFQVITFHQRGTKQSPCKSDDYSMSAYLSDIEAIRNFYGLSKFHLWGHSWGGLYAQIYAANYADRLLSLFLCSPGSGTNLEWKQTEKEVMALNKSKCTRWQWTKMGINSFLGMLGKDNAYKNLFKQVMENYNMDFVKTSNFGVDFDNLKATPINKTRPEIVRYPMLKVQEGLEYNVTISYGDHDIYQSSKDFVINRFPLATVVEIENSGHIPWLHNSNKFTAVLKEHYKRTWGWNETE
jgi:proline iminopeptidase